MTSRDAAVRARPKAISYRIDRADTLISVDASWSTFAENNGWDDAESVVGRSLWDFVAGPETQLIWRELITRARGGVTINVPFRCDATAIRRYLSLSVAPGSSGEVSFRSTTLRLVKREPLALLSNAVGTGEAILCCSWCKRFDIGEWVEVEEAIERLGLLETDTRPITHGLCSDCSITMRAAAGL